MADKSEVHVSFYRNVDIKKNVISFIMDSAMEDDRQKYFF